MKWSLQDFFGFAEPPGRPRKKCTRRGPCAPKWRKSCVFTLLCIGPDCPKIAVTMGRCGPSVAMPHIAKTHGLQHSDAQGPQLVRAFQSFRAPALTAFPKGLGLERCALPRDPAGSARAAPARDTPENDPSAQPRNSRAAPAPPQSATYPKGIQAPSSDFDFEFCAFRPTQVPAAAPTPNRPARRKPPVSSEVMPRLLSEARVRGVPCLVLPKGPPHRRTTAAGIPVAPTRGHTDEPTCGPSGFMRKTCEST